MIGRTTLLRHFWDDEDRVPADNGVGYGNSLRKSEHPDLNREPVGFCIAKVWLFPLHSSSFEPVWELFYSRPLCQLSYARMTRNKVELRTLYKYFQGLLISLLIFCFPHYQLLLLVMAQELVNLVSQINQVL